MSDALLSPEVGILFYIISAFLLLWSARKISAEKKPEKVPLMGILGAFIFAAQMINFSIPGTGSSGHIGGGMLLADKNMMKTHGLEVPLSVRYGHVTAYPD